jgi:hypothetical protein
MAIRFYAKHDLPPPEENSDAIPTKDEEEELRQIASALTVAAAASAAMPPGVPLATLLKVSKKPGLFLTRELPAPVEWALACHYQRGEEPPGTHWRDYGATKFRVFRERSNNRQRRILRRQLSPLSRPFKNHESPAGPTTAPTKLLQTDWARYFAAAASQFAVANSRSCVTARRYASKEEVPSTSF